MMTGRCIIGRLWSQPLWSVKVMLGDDSSHATKHNGCPGHIAYNTHLWRCSHSISHTLNMTFDLWHLSNMVSGLPDDMQVWVSHCEWWTDNWDMLNGLCGIVWKHINYEISLHTQYLSIDYLSNCQSPSAYLLRLSHEHRS